MTLKALRKNELDALKELTALEQETSLARKRYRDAVNARRSAETKEEAYHA